jgi:hypothetical protein
VATLLACPFCRELFTPSEGERCPHCGLLLVDLARLPPSLEARQEAEAQGELDPPELRRLGFWYERRGRGLMPVVAALGLATFVAPWVMLERPEQVTLSGFDLARAGVPWLFGGAIGWFILVPLVWSRRSVVELRGVRIIAATLAVLTALEAMLLLLRPPLESAYYSSGLRYGWGLYASLVVSAFGTYVAATLGGRLDDLRDLPSHRAAAPTEQPLH